MARPFVPPAFEPPSSFVGEGFRLEPLGPEHNERDHAAWMSSIDHIHSTPGFDRHGADPWPFEMSLEQNLEDLEMHARHFAERSGFTYSVLDGHEVIGCVYIYPTSRPGHDAEIRSWVTAGRAGMDRVVWEEVSAWMRKAWPFSNPYYAPRTRSR